MNHSLGHLGVAVYKAVVLKAFGLKGAGGNDAFAYRSRRLPGLCTREILERKGRYFALNIYSVHQRSRYLVEVMLNLPGRTDAVMRGVAIVAARAGIHRCHKHERARIGNRVLGSAYSDDPVFKRLAQNLQCMFAEFGQLVAEKYAIVSLRNLSGHGVCATADEGCF